MRVSCPFVLLALFFVGSECAPINPLDAVNQLGAHLEGTLNTAPVTHDVLNGNIIKKRELALPTSDLSSLTSATPPVDSVNQLGSPSALSSLPQLTSLPVLSTVPVLSTLPTTGVVPSLKTLPSVGSAPGLTKLPSTGAIPGLTKLPSTSAITGLASAPGLGSQHSLASIPGLKGKRGFGNFGSMMPMGSGGGFPKFGSGSFPGMGSIPGMSSIPMMGSGLPVIGSPVDAVNGFFGSAGGLTNPLNGMF